MWICVCLHDFNCQNTQYRIAVHQKLNTKHRTEKKMIFSTLCRFFYYLARSRLQKQHSNKIVNKLLAQRKVWAAFQCYHWKSSRKTFAIVEWFFVFFFQSVWVWARIYVFIFENLFFHFFSMTNFVLFLAALFFWLKSKLSYLKCIWYDCDIK